MCSTSNLDALLDTIARGSDTQPIIRLLQELQPTKADGSPSLWGSIEPPREGGPPLIQNFTVEQIGELVDRDMNEWVVKVDHASGTLGYYFAFTSDNDDGTEIDDRSLPDFSLDQKKGIVWADGYDETYVGVHYFEAQGWMAYFGATPTSPPSK